MIVVRVFNTPKNVQKLARNMKKVGFLTNKSVYTNFGIVVFDFRHWFYTGKMFRGISVKSGIGSLTFVKSCFFLL